MLYRRYGPLIEVTAEGQQPEVDVTNSMQFANADDDSDVTIVYEVSTDIKKRPLKKRFTTMKMNMFDNCLNVSSTYVFLENERQ